MKYPDNENIIDLKNHLFIIHGLINSVLKGESGCIDIHIYDIIKAFDALWLSDCMNDLWDTLPHSARDDKLGLIYETSKKNEVAVNTAVGQTDRVTIPEIVAQGGTWGPMLCSNSVKRKLVSIIPLACVDDLLSVSSCGFNSIRMNTTINTIMEMKKLQFHIPESGKKSKCHSLHIGKPSSTCPGMKVHGYKADTVTEAVYLGDIIRSDGKNTSVVRQRVNKGLGIVSNIMDILNTVSFGSSYFEIAISLREAKLINGILTSSEIWYGMLKSEEEELEEIDKLLLRRILGAPDSACVESLFLELGVIPLHIILKARRVNFLHYLASLNPSEMLYKAFLAQWKYPAKDDWTLRAKQNMEELEINLTLEEMRSKSAESFKRMVRIKVQEYTLNFLLEKKESHTKMDNLKYNKIKLQKYLKDPRIPVTEAKNLYRYRTRSAKYKENMKTSYQSTPCPFCFVQPDSQTHSVQCTVVRSKITVQGNYTDIFKENIPADISQTLLKISELREELI